ncbi:MAG TPA: lysophospholipid acyltransferase family protein, partial [Spirochaetota bacterium]|nr:lysophospholipid acyltransferase family protein [Spirochaetota bacterium]
SSSMSSTAAPGRRSRDGSLGEFKKGAFKMALDLELPILPVTIIGTKNILPSDTTNLMPGSARLIIHSPIPITGYTDENIEGLMDAARTTIAEGLPKDY